MILAALIAGGETLTVEFESDVNDTELVETVVCLANGGGFEPAQQEQMVRQYAQENGQITRREAAELCKLSADQASRLLRRLATEHPELRLEGERRGARYVWEGTRRAPKKRTPKGKTK